MSEIPFKYVPPVLNVHYLRDSSIGIVVFAGVIIVVVVVNNDVMFPAVTSLEHTGGGGCFELA